MSNNTCVLDRVTNILRRLVVLSSYLALINQFRIIPISSKKVAAAAAVLTVCLSKAVGAVRCRENALLLRNNDKYTAHIMYTSPQ